MIRLKVALKELYKLEKGWDEVLEGELRDLWLELLRMLVMAGGLKFRRSFKPKASHGYAVTGMDPTQHLVSASMHAGTQTMELKSG